MAIIKIPYKYKHYPDCSKATKVDKYLHHPNVVGFGAVILCFVLILIGGGLFNLNRDSSVLSVIAGVFFVAGFVMLLGGAFLIPWLADKLHIADRVYEKETGKKVY